MQCCHLVTAWRLGEWSLVECKTKAHGAPSLWVFFIVDRCAKFSRCTMRDMDAYDTDKGWKIKCVSIFSFDVTFLLVCAVSRTEHFLVADVVLLDQFPLSVCPWQFGAAKSVRDRPMVTMESLYRKSTMGYSGSHLQPRTTSRCLCYFAVDYQSSVVMYSDQTSACHL